MGYEDYYTTKAHEMRAFAEKASNPATRDEFLKLAVGYDELAGTAGENNAVRTRVLEQRGNPARVHP